MVEWLTKKPRKKGLKMHIGSSIKGLPLASTIVIPGTDRHGYGQSPYMRQRRTFGGPALRRNIAAALKGLKPKDSVDVTKLPAKSLLKDVAETLIKEGKVKTNREGTAIIGRRGVVRLMLAYAAHAIQAKGKSPEEVRETLTKHGVAE